MQSDTLRQTDDPIFDKLEHGAVPACGLHQGLRFGSAFQPIYSLSHGRVVGHEALLRATDAAGRAVAPPQVFDTGGNFAELLERDRLARLVHIANYFGSDAPNDQWLFLNVHPDVAAYGARDARGPFLRRVQRRFNVPSQLIVIEITEESVRDDDEFGAAISALREAGCLIAIDDFGAGQSNFDRVWRWRPEIVKLDRSLVMRAASDLMARRIVVQMVSLLHECGTLVLMEGIETELEAFVALEADADLVQGYYFGRPQAQRVTCGSAPAVLEDAWVNFTHKGRGERSRQRERIAPYLNAIGYASVLASAGRTMDEACRAFLSLPAAEACYLLDADGRQIGTNQWASETTAARSRPPKPFEDARGACWSRRPYFRRAVEAVGKVQTTRPYRTLNGGALCITVSIAFHFTNAEGRRELRVVGGDLRWQD
jgi:EAL domain-containing protein (putative c-di-GMP-specific phosphodiesterase class I)